MQAKPKVISFKMMMPFRILILINRVPTWISKSVFVGIPLPVEVVPWLAVLTPRLEHGPPAAVTNHGFGGETFTESDAVQPGDKVLLQASQDAGKAVSFIGSRSRVV